MTKLKIELTQEQVQRALIALGKEQYSLIADIIDTIKFQANDQINREE